MEFALTCFEVNQFMIFFLKKTQSAVARQPLGILASEEDLLMQIGKTPEPLPHPYTAAS